MIKKILFFLFLLMLVANPAFGDNIREKPIVLDSQMIESKLDRFFMDIKDKEGNYIKTNIITLKIYPDSKVLIFRDSIGNSGTLPISTEDFIFIAGDTVIHFINDAKKPYWCWESDNGTCAKF